MEGRHYHPDVLEGKEGGARREKDPLVPPPGSTPSKDPHQTETSGPGGWLGSISKWLAYNGSSRSLRELLDLWCDLVKVLSMFKLLFSLKKNSNNTRAHISSMLIFISCASWFYLLQLQSSLILCYNPRTSDLAIYPAFFLHISI